MGFDHRRTVTHRLAQAAHSYRVRAGGQLARIGLHSGQESLLKSLSTEDGMSMSDIAAALGVQPPTITKMISRLAAQDYVERRASSGDGRQAEVFLTERGRRAIVGIDKMWKRIEKTALADIDDKDRKRLRKLLRQVERNLGGKRAGKLPEDDEIELDDDAI
ncbi:MAG TPA: MarR family winged helix-turn-helix transcriptional regulator [Bauldia sp.]|nr:MarR family winged helix-turn-helix transcriptional regulator [Bauldia sp.]